MISLRLFSFRQFYPSAPVLLVSVVNGQEARAAAQGGTDVIDVKNPAEGALGAPHPGIIAEICSHFKGKKPVSVALGEFPGKPGAAALAAVGAAQFQPDFLKIAFPADAPSAEIVTTLRAIRNALTDVLSDFTPIPVVAVAYADTLLSSSWTLEDFTSCAREGGAAGCLVDTWEKNGKSLPDFLSQAEIEKFIDDCRRRELFCGLAGSLKSEHFGSLIKLGPDILGVRSAACGGDRLRGEVTPERVSSLKALCS